jgi:AraC family transcriptional regulator, transcriptional activator of pobA
MAQKYFKVNKSTVAQRFMGRFAHILEKKYHTGHTLADYAKELGVTATHLTRVCQRVNGKSASRFTQERVVAEARIMLSNTDYKILEISNILGFSSAAFYTRLFSAKQGQTPKEFRRSA